MVNVGYLRDETAHLAYHANLLPGPWAHVGVNQLRHLVHLVRTQTRPVLLVLQLRSPIQLLSANLSHPKYA